MKERFGDVVSDIKNIRYSFYDGKNIIEDNIVVCDTCSEKDIERIVKDEILLKLGISIAIQITS